MYLDKPPTSQRPIGKQVNNRQLVAIVTAVSSPKVRVLLGRQPSKLTNSFFASTTADVEMPEHLASAMVWAMAVKHLLRHGCGVSCIIAMTVHRVSQLLTPKTSKTHQKQSVLSVLSLGHMPPIFRILVAQ